MQFCFKWRVHILDPPPKNTANPPYTTVNHHETHHKPTTKHNEKDCKPLRNPPRAHHKPLSEPSATTTQQQKIFLSFLDLETTFIVQYFLKFQ